MAQKWTNEQLMAISEKNSNILVAAAAGSGKTAVLVQRIIEKITHDNIDVDRLLVVTFTNAVAAEMRERIYLEISKMVDDNKDILRQMILLEKASIMTLHSFCLEVIRNNFEVLDIDPSFRIADETETTLIKSEVLDELFEEEYESDSEGLINLLECYGNNKDDQVLQNMVLDLYHFVQSNPWPQKWLNDMRDNMRLKKGADFSRTSWGKVILDSVKLDLDGAVDDISKAIDIISNDPVLKVTYDKLFKTEYVMISEIVRMLSHEDDDNRWDKLYNSLKDIQFSKFPTVKEDSEFDVDSKEKIKGIRDEVKKLIKNISNKFVNVRSMDIVKDLELVYPNIDYLVYLVEKFMFKYQERKTKKNILDFSDLEHYCLKILTNIDTNGDIQPSEIALKYRDKFYEILVDEYQDSNDTQERIISMISKENIGLPNVFMVGDVKQSIYKFRQANPKLFLDKYNTYKDVGKYRKMQLFKNFRSRKGIINVANFIFNQVMSKDVGELDYTEEESLHFGANFPQCDDSNISEDTELYLVETNENTEYEDNKTDKEEEEEVVQEDIIDNIQCEARVVGKRILELMSKECKVYDKHADAYRKISYKDIVILLRTTKNWADTFVRELHDMGISVFADTDTGFFKTIEILVVLSYLQILDNPLQDIPLLSVLRSPIVGLDANELAKIRESNKDGMMFDAVNEFLANGNSEDETYIKLRKFLECYNELKCMAWYLPVDELIWELYNKTGYYAMVYAMPMGEKKQANLRVLFEKAKQFEETSYKGLFNFINFIDKLRNNNGDIGSAKTENDDVVRIMSIHKSKGLEFPVVFLSGCGKKINLMDANNSIIFHNELGFGPDIVDYERRISWPSVIKRAISEKIKQETLAEEMRILYVAITRAREKLIITGSVKDIKKSLNKWNSMSDGNDNKVSVYQVKKGRTFLDWILIALLKHKRCKDFFEEMPIGFSFNRNLVDDVSDWKVHFVNKSSVLGNNKNKEIFKAMLNDIEVSEELIDTSILDKLNWSYKYKGVELIPSKVSVTKMKRDEIYEVELKKPKFLEQREIQDAAKKGTILHFIMRHLDFSNTNIQEQIDCMIKKELITDVEAKSIDTYKIRRFMDSNLGKRIRCSKSINREVPFFLSIPYKDVSDLENKYMDEDVILQGVIDCYFEEDDYLVLVDYKSNFIENENDIDRIKEIYRGQITSYKNVLEKLTEKKVKYQYIYLFSNGEVIEY